MANAKIIEAKQNVVRTIKDKFEESASAVVFDYQGLTVTEVTELRRKLKEQDAEFKVYKNTLTQRAADELKLDLTEYLTGPNGIAFSKDPLAAVKILHEFSKGHEALELKGGVIDGNISDKKLLEKYATIPSRDTLLTMLAAGMLGTVKDLAIGLDLYSAKLEK